MFRDNPESDAGFKFCYCQYEFHLVNRIQTPNLFYYNYHAFFQETKFFPFLFNRNNYLNPPRSVILSQSDLLRRLAMAFGLRPFLHSFFWKTKMLFTIFVHQNKPCNDQIITDLPHPIFIFKF